MKKKSWLWITITQDFFVEIKYCTIRISNSKWNFLFFDLELVIRSESLIFNFDLVTRSETFLFLNFEVVTQSEIWYFRKSSQ